MGSNNVQSQFVTPVNFNQSLTPEGFASLFPWSKNQALDLELKSLAQEFYKVTLGQPFTDDDSVYHTIKCLSVRASQIGQVYQQEPQALDLSFDIVFEFLKSRFSEHLHNLIWSESKLFDMPYMNTPNTQLVEAILRDEMQTLWFEGDFEQVLNDDYRRCVDVWRNGERTYFAPETVQKWVGALHSVDYSQAINTHPIKTVAIAAFAGYTAPLSLTYFSLWTAGGLANAGIQYETAEIGWRYAEINGSRDAYELANRDHGYALGLGTQAALPLIARSITIPQIIKQPQTTGLVPTASTMPVLEPTLRTIPAPRQITGPVDTTPEVVVTALDDGSSVLTVNPTTQKLNIGHSFEHPVAGTPNLLDSPVRSILFEPFSLEPTAVVRVDSVPPPVAPKMNNSVAEMPRPPSNSTGIFSMWGKVPPDIDVRHTDYDQWPGDACFESYSVEIPLELDVDGSVTRPPYAQHNIGFKFAESGDDEGDDGWVTGLRNQDDVGPQVVRSRSVKQAINFLSYKIAEIPYVLVVDDDPRRANKRYLPRGFSTNIEFVIPAHLDELLQILHDRGRPAFIIGDIELKTSYTGFTDRRNYASGFDLLSEAFNQCHIPTIFYTGYTYEEVVTKHPYDFDYAVNHEQIYYYQSFLDSDDFQNKVKELLTALSVQ